MKKAEKNLKDAEPVKIPKKIKDKLKPLVQKLLNKCSYVKVLSKRVEWTELDEFFELIRDIQVIEKPYTPTLPDRKNNWELFHNWCSEHGAKYDYVVFKEIHEGNYGAMAETDIKENDLFLSVPRKMMMSEITAKSSKLGPLISSDPILQHMSNVQISMHLLMEFLNPDSQWKPYISILPSKFNTVLYFSINELKELQGSPVLDEVINILYSVARQYCYFFQLFQTNSARSLNIGQYFTYELYRWAVSVVMTRQNSIPSPEGDGSVTSLVPLFDMCNHASGKLSTDFSLENDALISYACKSFKKGEEVSTFYGNRTNGEFFVHNAFVYPENENDAVEIKLGFGKSDPLLSMKQELSNKMKIPLNGSFYIHKGPLISKELLTFLIINVMKADELQNALNGQCEDFILDETSDVTRRALCFLKDRIFLLLKCYKTTLEEDEDLLKSTVPETLNHQLVLQLRICEKKILNDAYKYCVENTN